jgi:Right handed beta helix region
MKERIVTDLDRRLLLGVAGIAGIAAINRVARSGSLNPPPGPVSPTMKSLDEVEARTPVQSLAGDSSTLYIISQPGSYYLTGNVTGVSGQNGIVVTVANVSIDLNGFALIGVSGSTNAIHASSTANSLTVRNGSISTWGGAGVDAGVAFQVRIEGLMVDHCAGGGMSIGQRSFVRNCGVHLCSGFGIATGNTCRVVECIVDNTLAGGDGISCDYASVIQDCSASENAGSGFYASGSGVLIVGCKASFNTLDGVTINSSFAEVIDTVATLNSANGIHSTSGNGRIDHCSANRNSLIGIVVDMVSGENTVTRCSSTSNFSNTDYSIAAGNKPAQVVSWGSPATGFASGDPVANIR